MLNEYIAEHCHAPFGGIVDSTLREGEQTAGVFFSRTQKLEIVRWLSVVGVEEIELGVASPRIPELVSLVDEANRIVEGECRTSLWCRCYEEDIQFARLCNPATLSLSMPVSDVLLREKLHRDRRWALENLERSISRALDLGFATVSVGLEDATRADRDFLLQAAVTVAGAGASRLRLADTVGVSSPGEMGRMVTQVRGVVSVPVAVHTHNDFGMATANAVAALEAGAQWVDATVLGLGERAGNCRLEEIVGYLSLQRGFERYHPGELRGLCRVVADAAHVAIPAHHPVVGDAIFTCESGLHVQGLVKNPCTYEPYGPERLGRARTLLFGCKTGKSAVKKKLAVLGYVLSDEDVEELVVHVRSAGRAKKTSFGEQDLVLLAMEKGLINPDISPRS